jgi:hypothetical protein
MIPDSLRVPEKEREGKLNRERGQQLGDGARRRRKGEKEEEEEEDLVHWFLFLLMMGYYLSVFFVRFFVSNGVVREMVFCVGRYFEREREREKEQYGWLFWAAEVFKKEIYKLK